MQDLGDYASEQQDRAAQPTALSAEFGEEERLEVAVVGQLERYFAQLNGAQPHPLHPLVMGAVEKTLLMYVMRRCANNQCKAAQLLGINRNTLRKKLVTYGLLAD